MTRPNSKHIKTLNMPKQLLFLLFFILNVFFLRAQKQSIIYDATTIMNAKYGLDALLLPTETSLGADSFVTIKSKPLANISSTPGLSQSQAVILEVLRRNADLSV